MKVYDAQVHLLPGTDAADVVHAMDQAGVDAALLVNQSKYGPDNSRQTVAAEQFPGRLAVVAGVDVSRSDIEDQVRALADIAAVVAVRIVINDRGVIAKAGLDTETLERLGREIDLWEAGHAYRQLFASLQRRRLPICIYMPNRISELRGILQDFPDLQFVLDHLNLIQHPRAITSGVDPFQDLGRLLDLSSCANLALKATAMPTLSMSEFPFPDLWSPLQKVISAFGSDRIMWGTDWTQVTDRCTYQEGVAWLRASDRCRDADKAQLMGLALRRIFRWPKDVLI